MSVNKVILLGNVGKDPEVRYVSQDTPVATFSLATTERGYTASNGTQIPERTDWHNIVAWRGLAKLAESYIRKGTQLYIEGRLRNRNRQDQNGVTHYVTEIVADEIQLLGKRPENGVAPLTNASATPQPAQSQQGQFSSSANNNPSTAKEDDNFPF